MKTTMFRSVAAAVMLALGSIGAHALEVGEKAPLFEAPSTKGTIRLADYGGKKNVVLAFYFKDFTPV